MPYYEEAAVKALDWIQENLVFSAGKWAGQPFRLLDWEWEEVVAPLFGTLKEERGLRQYRTCYVEIPKKNGKALDLETDIPTINGWKKMRDIEVGDILFDEKGNQCQVTNIPPILPDRPCYEVIFNDGERLIADADHKWAVTELLDTSRKGIRIQYEKTIKTTKEMSQKLTSHGGRCKTFKIRVNEAIQCDEKNLLIPPYTLGSWLGDGNSRNIGLTCCDAEILDEIREEGIKVSSWKSKDRAPTYCLGKGQGIQIKLKELNLIKNKHIPEIYLRASYRQRLALLRGLMDMDGYCSKEGQCEFTTTKKQLRDGFIELARTLGYKPMLLSGIATLNGKDCGPKYRIAFFAFRGDKIFNVGRKREAQKAPPRKPSRSQYRQVIGINSVESRPVKCLTVDSPSNLYLCGRGFIPTHNTEMAAALALYMLCADGENSPEVYSAAADRNQATLVYKPASYMVRHNKKLRHDLKVLDSQKRIINYTNSGFYQVLSAETYTKHGLNPSCVIIDELHGHPNDELIRVLTAGTDYAREQQIIFIITTAGIYDKTSVWWRYREKARQIKEGIIEDDSFWPVLYIADPEKDDPEDEKLWKRVNPSLGHIFMLDKVREDFKQAKQNPIDYADFLRFRLNIPIKQQSRWLPMEAWDECGDKIDTALFKGRRCYGGIDLSSKIDLTAFTLVFPPEDDNEKYIILSKFYVPEETVIERSRIDRVHYNIWVDEGYMTATPGNVIDYAYIEKDIIQASHDYQLMECGYDPWGATDLATRLFNDEGITMVEMRQGTQTLSEPAKDLLVHIMKGEINHGNHPVLRWCADNLVMIADANENVRPAKDKATDRIDGIVALIMAWGRMLFGEKKHPEPGIVAL